MQTLPIEQDHVDHLINHPGILGGFSILIIIMLLLDLGVFNKNSHVVSNKEAAIWSIVWISLAMGFSGVIYYLMGVEQFTQFQSAYWIEKALSVDNLFVFILVFGFFSLCFSSLLNRIGWHQAGFAPVIKKVSASSISS